MFCDFPIKVFFLHLRLSVILLKTIDEIETVDNNLFNNNLGLMFVLVY